MSQDLVQLRSFASVFVGGIGLQFYFLTMSLSGFGIRLMLGVQLGMRDENSQESSQSFGFAQHDVKASHRDQGFKGDDENAELDQRVKNRLWEHFRSYPVDPVVADQYQSNVVHDPHLLWDDRLACHLTWKLPSMNNIGVVLATFDAWTC